jgi:hypothetical protein
MNPAFIPLLPNSKLPAIKDWPNNYSLAMPQTKDCGLVTGSPSGILVWDIDKKSGGLETLEKLIEEGTFDPEPHSYVQTQSGGWHFYFQYPTDGTVLRNRAGFMPGCDIRGEGGFVKCYADIDAVFLNNIKPIPEWLLNLIKPSVKSKAALDATTMIGAIGEGGRNQYITKVAGKLQRSNLLTLEGLEAINDRDCSPALDAKEVELIFNSISRYDPDENPVGDMQSVVADEAIPVKASDLSESMIVYLDDKEKVKGEDYLLEGYSDLLGGGARLSELTLINAEAKVGKSTFIHNLIWLWMTKKGKQIPVAYASRELTPETEVLPDLLSIHLQKNIRLDKTNPEEYKKIISNWPLYFANGYGVFEYESIHKWVLECKKLGISYYYLDHFHYCLMEPEDSKAASKFIRDLKAMVKRENIHMTVVVQPPKLMEGQKLSINTLRGGAALGQAADNVVVLERFRCETPNILQIRTVAVRSKLGKIGTIYLQYNPKTCTLTEVEPDEVVPQVSNGPVYEA